MVVDAVDASWFIIAVINVKKSIGKCINLTVKSLIKVDE